MRREPGKKELQPTKYWGKVLVGKKEVAKFGEVC